MTTSKLAARHPVSKLTLDVASSDRWPSGGFSRRRSPGAEFALDGVAVRERLREPFDWITHTHSSALICSICENLRLFFAT